MIDQTDLVRPERMPKGSLPRSASAARYVSAMTPPVDVNTQHGFIWVDNFSTKTPEKG
jgi:hypothetical protein